MAEEDNIQVQEHAVEEDSPINHVDLHDSESMMSWPDNTNAVAIMQQVESMVRTAIDDERSRYFDINKGVLRVNTNKSGAIQFRRFSIVNTMGPVMIVKEKDSRGDCVITNFGEGSIFIGVHPGTMAEGSDTVEVAGGASRVIRTRTQLWVATASATAIPFDVQEEFD